MAKIVLLGRGSGSRWMPRKTGLVRAQGDYLRPPGRLILMSMLTSVGDRGGRTEGKGVNRRGPKYTTDEPDAMAAFIMAEGLTHAIQRSKLQELSQLIS